MLPEELRATLPHAAPAEEPFDSQAKQVVQPGPSTL